MRTLAILGASGHGKVIADLAEQLDWDQIQFFDDRWPEVTRNGHWDVQGSGDDLLTRLTEFDGVLVGIGHNGVRLEKCCRLREAGATLVTLVHPAACVSPYASLGDACVVMAGAVINVDTVIGFACIINTGATVDHDCTVADGVHISPGANLAGGVQVGEQSWLGIGSSVRQLVSVGASTVIGAGATVVNDVSDGQTVVGCPARPVVKE